MKRTLKFVLAMAMAMVMLMSGSAMAEGTFVPQGSCIVPGVYYHYTGKQHSFSPTYILTNITGDKITCRVVVTDHDGLDVSYLGRVVTGGTTWQTVASGGSAFEIPAYSTRIFQLAPSGSKKVIAGFAKIEWKSSNRNLINALVGSGFASQEFGSERTDSYVPINNGQPF